MISSSKEIEMPYSERAYFEGDHCQHCASWEEHLRLERYRRQAREMIRRRSAP